MNVFEQIGEYVPDSLIAGNKKGTIARGISLAPGQGVLKRGTLLTRNDSDQGEMLGLAEGGDATTVVPSGILTDDVDTGTDADGDAVIAEEYITGVFNPDAIIVKEGTDVKDFTETMRSLGMFMKEVE